MSRSMQLRIITVRTYGREMLEGKDADEGEGFLWGAKGRFLVVNCDELLLAEGW